MLPEVSATRRLERSATAASRGPWPLLVPFNGRSRAWAASTAATTLAYRATAATSSTATPSTSATTAPRVREVDVNVKHMLLTANALRVLGQFILIVLVVIVAFTLLAQLVHFLPLAGIFAFASLPDVELRFLMAAAQRLPLIQRQFLKKISFCIENWALEEINHSKNKAFKLILALRATNLSSVILSGSIFVSRGVGILGFSGSFLDVTFGLGLLRRLRLVLRLLSNFITVSAPVTGTTALTLVHRLYAALV